MGMKFNRVRGFSVITFDNGVQCMSVTDYAIFIRDDVASVVESLRLYEYDNPTHIFFNGDDDEAIVSGVAYDDGDFGIIGGKKDGKYTYGDMMKMLLEY